MSSSAMTDQNQVFRYLQKLEIHDFQALRRNASHIYMKIIAGSTVHMSRTYEINSQSVIIWPMSPNWVDLSASTVVKFQVYRRSRIPLKPGILLGHAKKHMTDIVPPYLLAAHQPPKISPKAPSLTVGVLLKSTEPMALMLFKLGEMKAATQAVKRKRFDSMNISQITTRSLPCQVEAYDLQTSVHDRADLYLKVLGRSLDRQTPAFPMSSGLMPSWSVSIDLDGFEASSLVKFEIYANGKTLVRTKLLGSAEIPVLDLLYNAVFSLQSPSMYLQRRRLRLSAVDFPPYRSSREVAGELVKALNKPDQHSSVITTVLDSLEPLKVVIDMLAEVHPAAKIAFNIVSIGYNVLKKREEEDQLVLDLYVTMLDSYHDACENEILRRRDRLYGIYQCLFQQTIECSYFIEGYARKGFIGQIFTPNLLDKANDFRKGFETLRKKLQSGIAEETLVVTLGTQQLVEELAMRESLRGIRPSIELKPKSTCMKGTRVETINFIISWIAKCSPGMLWCTGLAGTGKSSLVGTLHEVLAIHAGSRNRLGAFIRYDRIVYSDASHSITRIAYSLGMYDTRIGTAISAVIRRNRGVPAYSASEQFRLLLQEPLESLLELADEGPLVVIIDGLDESDASKEMLAVLSRGFGPKLPFMRLLVFSRPIDTISRVFAAPGSVVTRFALDTASREVHCDIRHFIQAEFTSIHNDPLTRDDRFQMACLKMNAIDELARRASGLFIWASTVCRFIGECPSISRLEALLRSDVPNDATDSLTTLYKTALDTILSESKILGSDEDLIRWVLDVLGAIIVARTPPGMTPETFNIVLSPNDLGPRFILNKLGSLLQTSEDGGGFILLIHKSLYDFLTNPSRRKERWFIDIEAYRTKFARQCLSSVTGFLGSWKPDADIPIPSHIQHYAVIGPLWHIQAFDVQDFNVLRILFDDQLSKWLQVADITRRVPDILKETTKVLYWVNGVSFMPLIMFVLRLIIAKLVTDLNCSFRLLTYHACQDAEVRFGPILRAPQLVVGPEIPYEPSARLCPSRQNSEVHWHNIIPYHGVYFISSGAFSVSADSQTLVGTPWRPEALVMRLHINVNVQEKPSQTPISSFFASDISLKNPKYDAFGCLVTRSAVIDYQSDSHSQDWEVVGPYSESGNQSASAFISIHDIDSSRSCHYIFRGLKTYNLLLYTTGIVVIDTQAMVLIRIDLNSLKDQRIPRIWTRIDEGDALQMDHFSLWNKPFGVSKDGLTLAHIQYCSDDKCLDPPTTLRRWNTATGTILSTDYLPESLKWKPTGLVGLSFDGTMVMIRTSRKGKLCRDIIVPSSSDNSGLIVIPLEEKLCDAVFLPDDRRIAYVTDKDMVIRDIYAEKETFRHPFPHAEGARSIVMTPNGKTLVTDVARWSPLKNSRIVDIRKSLYNRYGLPGAGVLSSPVQKVIEHFSILPSYDGKKLLAIQRPFGEVMYTRLYLFRQASFAQPNPAGA
ncbi:hypothetical protein EDD18DRAFT_1107838 [Armillaria luteobubalina]|uniref:Nephrocystin 3-like N-terminal domain-containing protein n=1 Tax=Armillaria luteobubalina TaxID=153913 RepID=A0AA39Q156_9AGAR|nr:hypothetical protein EDD18DRAFT_1107838 [Armillaria luteobubalina]